VTLYGGVHRGTAARPNANPVLAWMRDDDIAHDPWGTAMAWEFAVCDYLHHVALTDPPEECGYQSAAVRQGEGYEEEGWPAGAIVEMAADTYTLAMAARILSRYVGWCVAAGRDY
jgi:hypothetical protein